jgi:hypothetical protein
MAEEKQGKAIVEYRMTVDLDPTNQYHNELKKAQLEYEKQQKHKELTELEKQEARKKMQLYSGSVGIGNSHSIHEVPR